MKVRLNISKFVSNGNISCDNNVSLVLNYLIIEIFRHILPQSKKYYKGFMLEIVIFFFIK